MCIRDSVDILHIKADETFIGKDKNQLGKYIIYVLLYTVTKTVDRDKIRMLITGKPNIMTVSYTHLDVYKRQDYNVRINFRNGAWGELEVSSDEHLNLHMAATCLHYGQEAFEGLKAFRGKDGKVRIFRLEERCV